MNVSPAFTSTLVRKTLALALVAAPATLLACPVCDTATGREVRAAIFSGDFFHTLFAILAPFPVLLALIAVINFLLTPRPRPGLESAHSNASL